MIFGHAVQRFEAMMPPKGFQGTPATAAWRTVFDSRFGGDLNLRLGGTGRE
jgi:hypothetical protein